MKQQETRPVAFIDMDDTLLGPDKTISADNRQALDRLRAANIEIVLASGRHHRNLRTYRDEIDGLDWLISSHGSLVESMRTGEVLLEIMLPADLILELRDHARRAGVSCIAYHRTGAYVEEENEWTREYEKRSGWPLLVRDLTTLPTGEVQKILWTGDAARITALTPVMKELFGARAQVLRTEPLLLEFFSLEVNKAVGAQALISKKGVPRECTLAFGDGNNDVELLGWAGVSVAMAHGCEPARKAARCISPPGPADEAFARAVEMAMERMGGCRG